MRRPTSVEPVKEIRDGTGCETKASPISEPRPAITFTSPLGNPALSKHSAMRNADAGVSEAGLRTTALPVATAGTTERIASTSGTFHGAMAPTTPLGVL